MKPKRDYSRASSSPMTARETARIIEGVAKLYELPNSGNSKVVAALRKAAKLIADLGDEPMSKLPKNSLSTRAKHALPSYEFSSLSVGQVLTILNDPRATKTYLIEMALARFGMPKARLTKLPFDETVDAIKAAAANEESLEIIAKNADQSGRERQS